MITKWIVYGGILMLFLTSDNILSSSLEVALFLLAWVCIEGLLVLGGKIESYLTKEISEKKKVRKTFDERLKEALEQQKQKQNSN